MADILIEVKDAFDNVYSVKAKIPIIDLALALKYNPRFGYTEQLYDSYSVDLNEDSETENDGGEQK